MIVPLKTHNIETEDFIIKITKENLIGILITGYVEITEKKGIKKTSLYTLLGQTEIMKTKDFDKYKLHLIKSDLSFAFTYEMNLTFYNDFIDIVWDNLYTGLTMYKARGKYLNDSTESEYEIKYEGQYDTSNSLEIKQLELTVKNEIFKKRGDLETYYENGTNLHKFIIEYYGGSDTINGYDSSGNLILKSAVFTKRIDNKFSHYEMNIFAENKEDNICYMNCLYSHYGDFETQLIMIHKGITYLFHCQVERISANEIKLKEKIPKIN